LFTLRLYCFDVVVASVLTNKSCSFFIFVYHVNGFIIDDSAFFGIKRPFYYPCHVQKYEEEKVKMEPDFSDECHEAMTQ